MTGTRCARFRRRDRCRPTGALAGALVALAVAAWPGATAAVVFSVDTALDTHDQNPGDGLCADAAGMCSLRAGVEEANALAGALDNNALTNLVRCTIIGNTNLQQGGGIANFGSTATLNIIDSAILNNSSGIDGGGLYNASGTVNIANSTISGNDADDEGGGIYSTFGAFNATNLTVSRNVADHDADGTGGGGGIFQWGAAFAVRGTIVAGNFDTPGNRGPGDPPPVYVPPIKLGIRSGSSPLF